MHASSSGVGSTSVVDTGVETTETTGGADTSTSTSTSCGLPPEPPPELETCDAERTREASVGVEGISPKHSDEQVPCVVEAITIARDPPGIVVELACSPPDLGATPVRIGIGGDSVSTLPLLPGSDVLVGYAGGGLFDEILLTLRRADGTLVLLWIDAGWLPSADEPSIPSASFIDPLVLAFDPEDCGYECDPFDGGCFIQNSCPCVRRLAIDVEIGDASQRIVDGRRGSVGGAFDVHVVTAGVQTAADGGPCLATDVFPWVRLLAVASE